MKKNTFLISILLLVLMSCSSNDPAPDNNPDPVLNTEGTRLKKGISTVGASSFSSEYFYNGTHLAKIVSVDNGAESSRVFEYTGELITKQYSYVAGTLRSVVYLDYNSSNQLVHRLLLNYANNKGYKAIFVYNPDNSVTVTTFSGDFNNQNLQDEQTTKLYFANGEIVKKESSRTNNGVLEVVTYDYTYDTKNNPNMNIPGYHKAFFFDSFGAYILDNQHNFNSVTTTSSASSSSSSYSYNFIYNTANYPISQKRVVNGVETNETRLYFYE